MLLRPLPYPDSDADCHAPRAATWRGTARRRCIRPTSLPGRPAHARSSRSRWCRRLRSTCSARPARSRSGALKRRRICSGCSASEPFSVVGSPETRSRPGDRHDVVILGHGFWQRWFGGDPSVVGKQLRVTDGSLTIIGVAPELRLGSMEPEVFTPLGIDPANPGSIGSRSFQCYGRLRPGVTVDTARAEMATVASTLSRELPFDEGMGVFVSGLHDYLVTESRRALQLLTAIVVTVLLIACANLAGLLLARGFARRGEFAVRTALGAGRGRLIRQLVIESLVLSVTGGLLGLALASMATGALLALAPDTLTAGLNEPVGLNLTAVSFTFGLSTLTAFVFGLVPAWQAAGTEPHAALQSRARGGTADRRHHRIRSLLVVAEVALAVVLLVGAGLLLRTFDSLNRVGLGFQPAEAVTMNLFLGVRPPEARIALVDQILERVEAIPGVKAAGTIQFLPLAGRNCGTGFWIEGQSVGDASRTLSTDCSLISRGYFAAMGDSARRRARLRCARSTEQPTGARREPVVRDSLLPARQGGGPSDSRAGHESGAGRDRRDRRRYPSQRTDERSAANSLSSARADARVHHQPRRAHVGRAGRSDGGHPPRHSRCGSLGSRLTREDDGRTGGRCTREAKALRDAGHRRSRWSRCCLRRSASTASSPTSSRSARTRSASGSRSAPHAGGCSGRSLGQRSTGRGRLRDRSGWRRRASRFDIGVSLRDHIDGSRHVSDRGVPVLGSRARRRHDSRAPGSADRADDGTARRVGLAGPTHGLWALGITGLFNRQSKGRVRASLERRTSLSAARPSAPPDRRGSWAT